MPVTYELEVKIKRNGKLLPGFPKRVVSVVDEVQSGVREVAATNDVTTFDRLTDTEIASHPFVFMEVTGDHPILLSTSVDTSGRYPVPVPAGGFVLAVMEGSSHQSAAVVEVNNRHASEASSVEYIVGGLT